MLSRREVVALTFLFIASLPAVTARLYSSDEVEYFSYLRSLWFDHDVSFENEYQYFYDHQIARSPDFHTTFLELETAAHRRINDVTVDGYSRPYVSAVAYGSACYGFAAIVLAIIAARRLIGAHAVTSGLAIWLGTP